MYNKQKGVFVGLTLKLYPTGKIPPKYSFKGSRVNMWKCSITKKNFRGTESWESSNHILPYIREGYSGNYYGKTEPLENPKGYEKGDEIFVITYILTKGGEYKKNIDGFKPIGQTVPQYAPQQMTEAQPSAPENAVPVTMEDHKAMSELDDEIPF
tara:strand:- start:18 stop:482 length:465 start_codon:yes stop_codon:yes gene_type:complete